MMYIMYVGFQKVDPSVDLRMTLANAYREALELFGRQRSVGG